MTIKKAIRKTLETALVTIPLWGPLGVLAGQKVYYNSLTKQEKIEYLEMQLNTAYKRDLPPLLTPKFGGALVISYSKTKRNIQSELEKLKATHQ